MYLSPSHPSLKGKEVKPLGEILLALIVGVVGGLIANILYDLIKAKLGDR